MSDNFGCLRRYVRVAQMMRPEIHRELVAYANSKKGFLCNFQIPLMFACANQARGKMAEIGCWFGRTTSVLLAAAEPDLRLYCVDTFRGSEEHQDELKGKYFRADFDANLTQFAGRYEVREGFSHEIAASFQDGELDHVWIDASHDYKNVKLDIASWLPKLKSSGIMLGHDYPEPSDPNGGFEELTKAVNESVRDSADFKDFGWACGIWGAVKK